MMKRLDGLMILCVLLLGATSAFAGFYSSKDDVNVLNPANFDKLVGEGDSVWLVEFYAEWCGHCKALQADWVRAAKALRGIVNVGAVDADTHRELGSRFGVKGFPTIKIMYAKNGKLTAVDYQGGRTAAAIVEGTLAQAAKVALGRIGASAAGGGGGGQGGCGAGGGGGGGGGGEDLFPHSDDLVKLTDADFHEQVTNSDDPWLIKFYAPWCGHCKRLAPEFERFAAAVRGKVKAGVVDCTTQQATCSEFKVQGYPTLKWFGADKDAPADYDGGRDEAALTAYALERWQAQMPPPERWLEQMPPPEVHYASLLTYCPPWGATAVVRQLAPTAHALERSQAQMLPPEVKQLTDNEGFVADCAGAAVDAALDLAAVPARQLCVLLFVPNILDSGAAGRNAYLDVMKKLAEQHKTRPFSYLWAEGGSQPTLEASVGVGGYGYPALVALSPSKLKFAALRSAFEYGAVKTFVDHVRQGTERVQLVHGDALPTLVSVDSWDGGDGQAPEEDEFSLEDLMSEEL